MDWSLTAEHYAGSFGWGTALGKTNSISRIMKNEDMAARFNQKMVVSTRSRGVLSGFLVIVPSTNNIVFLQPVQYKKRPIRIRMRIAESIKEHGLVFSAYISGSTLCIEDVVVWKNEDVWNHNTFTERREYLNDFSRGFQQDSALQGFTISISQTISLDEFTEPAPGIIVEFIPDKEGQKRMLWIPEQKAKEEPIVTDTHHLAKRETAIGPDVFSIWRGEERLGLGMVRTLAISRSLRAFPSETIPINTTWNKQFEKWEILSVHS